MSHEHDHRHEHGPDHDHDHDHDHGVMGSEQDHALWKRDRIELRSVGIDIGSSTSHLVFSTLELRRQSAVLSSRFELTGRRIDYESRILITPFTDGAAIDTRALSAFVDSAYEEAGLTPADLDTGAVIATGDAARKDNAEAIVRLFSEQAGKFVCASAGPLFEAKMAAYGSGAVARSLGGSGPATVLNLDVGGGTAKLAVVRDGVVLETAAMNVGARLVTTDDYDVLTKVEKAAAIVSRHRGLELRVGRRVSRETRRELAAALAQCLLEAAARNPLSTLAAELMITPPLRHPGPIDAVFFSGGVAEYLYHVEAASYGDIGILLAQQIRALLPGYLPDVPVEAPLQRIRATVIGASQFTAQVSGNTIYVASPGLLPLRNLPVVPVRLDGCELTPTGVGRAVRQAFEKSGLAEGDRRVALAVHWPHGPAYSVLSALCAGMAGALENTVRNRDAIVLVLDSDLARLVGANLSQELQGYRNIVCIDGVQLHDFDFIDISEEHADARVVTVVIKSLIFSG